MRFIAILISIVAAFLLLRSLLTPLIKALVALLAPEPGPSPASAPEAKPAAGELKKDPVCGTFVSPELAVTQTIKGQTLHFCSQKCRDEYARSA